MAVIEIREPDASEANMLRNRLEAKHKNPIIRDRFHMIWLLYKGFRRGECAKILGVSPNTITKLIHLYHEGDLELLSCLNYKKPVSKLMAHKEKICKAINELLPDCILTIREWFRQKLGIERSLQRVRIFIKKLGFKYRKAIPFPGKKLSEEWIKEQEVFKTETLFPSLGKVAYGTSNLLFLDSAHFVQGRFDRFLWSKKPCYNPTSHGRYRVPNIKSMI